MRRFLRDNGLTLALAVLFLITYAGGQFYTGMKVENDDRLEHGVPALTAAEYLVSAHFMEATTENWESEFLQMFVYVFMTAFLFQRGSAESNDPDKPPRARAVTARSPWPVRRGGAWRRLYSHSLSLVLAGLFFVSFGLHALSSLCLENQHRVRDGQSPLSLVEHLGHARFWFESFQNWQSEFLAIGAMVVLTIFLREKNSPESKAVEAPHDETG